MAIVHSPYFVTWLGNALIEPGRLIFRGQLGSAHAHGHAALQIVTIDDGAALLVDADGRGLSAPAAIIPAGAEHSIEAQACQGMMLYLEPTRSSVVQSRPFSAARIATMSESGCGSEISSSISMLVSSSIFRPRQTRSSLTWSESRANLDVPCIRVWRLPWTCCPESSKVR